MTCVEMAKKVIELSVEHQRKGLLCPASWPSVYTVFIATICLIFAHATRKETTEDDGVHTDIEDGIRLLACTACSTDTGSVRCLEILRRLLTRVSYAVDVNFDKICGETSPCCTIAFPSRDEGDSPHSLDELHIAGPPPPKADRRQPLTSPMPSVESNGHQWSMSPDVTMTQPSFSDVGPASHPSEQHNPQSEDEQMFDIPHGGLFNWHGLRNEESKSTEAPSGHQRGARLLANSSSESHSKLTAEDIAAFMQSNPLDAPNNQDDQ